MVAGLKRPEAPPGGTDPRRRPIGLRGRLMLIGVAGLVVAMAVSGWAFYVALTIVINRTLDNSAQAAAQEVAAMVNANRLPEVIPASGAQVIQVVSADQRVLAGSAAADKITPLLDEAELTAALRGESLVVPGSRLGTGGELRVRAVRAGPGSAPVSVIAAWSYGDVLATRKALRNALLITLPLLVVALAAVAWRVIDKTLRPVEELRAGAEAIAVSVGTGPGRDDRLPVPAAADEIQALALTLNAMLDRLTRARERQRWFVADAAHELRSPLASIQAQLEVAERLGEAGSLPAELLIDVRRLSALVEDLLLLARSEADARPPAEIGQVDVVQLLAEVAAELGDGPVELSVRSAPLPTAGAAARRLSAAAAADGLSVTADAGELRRAVGNLTSNAVRHARTAVELAAGIEGNEVVISVSDDGPGIAAADRERVFERFARLDDARTRDAGGSGLGLAIVRELVTRAGGSVRFADGTPPYLLRAEIRVPRA